MRNRRRFAKGRRRRAPPQWSPCQSDQDQVEDWIEDQRNRIRIRLKIRIRTRMIDSRGRHLSKDDNVLLWLSRHLSNSIKASIYDKVENDNKDSVKSNIHLPGEQKRQERAGRGREEKACSLQSSSNVQLVKCLLLILLSRKHHSQQQNTKRQGLGQSDRKRWGSSTLSSFQTETCKIGACPVLKGSKLIMSVVVVVGGW